MRSLLLLLPVVLTCTACGEAEPRHAPGSEVGVTDPSLEAVATACVPGASVSCSSLASSWAGGTATCRPSGNGYNVTACTRAGNPARRLTETVRPALRDARWTDARCNLGDEFVLEVTFPPVPPGGALPTQWVLRLEGGGFCAFDSESPLGGCGNRGIDLVSSVNLPADRALRESAPASPDDFSGAIDVLGHYCSSDLWTGTALDAPDITYKGTRRDWRFTGAHNVEAMLAVLVERYGLDDNKPLRVLWRGGSAGGFGAFNNTHRVVGRLPKAAKAGRLLVFPGSGYVPLDWTHPDYPVLGIGSGLEAFGQLTGIWKSSLTPSCVAARTPGDPVHPPHECISGPVLYDIITAPVSEGGFDLPTLVWQNRQDQLYMSNAGLPYLSTTNTPAERAARTEWVQTMNRAMGVTGRNASSRMKWLYAPSDPVVLRANGSVEPNVHGAQLYSNDPPTGPTHSLNSVLSRFWNTMLNSAPGRGRATGEVHTFDCNWVPSRDATGCD
ncbi:pectin acetylesterase-family hydrolase [Myxococcus qinghaiensis]|uniref:pectin acetylesterase-family hydrolase n=1 Tax=Myxococcus qinghaiensis TaxID=2906758 RepID=UPI0020A82A01|nr:pectin acetylesterase-family hydrolase [Myxococcus qinghaiensis]MCP3161564.1 pectin acetylesterase-family hydrolase [Myxococcus qinghaiensis]